LPYINKLLYFKKYNNFMKEHFNTYELTEKESYAIERHLSAFSDSYVFAHSKRNPALFLSAQSYAARELNKVLPERIKNAIDQFVNGDLDHIVIRNMPTGSPPPTPSTIPKATQPNLGLVQLASISVMIGKPVNDAGIANTIRFDLEGNGIANEETWHSHPQSGAAVFFFLRGDPNAKINLITAKNVYNNANDEIKELLLRKQEYVDGIESFSLINKLENGKLHFSKYLFDISSPIQQMVPNLLLPDMKVMLEGLINHQSISYDKKPLTHLLDSIKNSASIAFKAGDLVVYDELATVRQSEGYKISNFGREARWALVYGTKHEYMTDTPNISVLSEKDIHNILYPVNEKQ
jgi:hypothetical protein